MKKSSCIKDVLFQLIQKYNRRNIKYSGKEINRSISVRPKDFYKKYGKESGDTETEKVFNEAMAVLEKRAFIAISRTRYSDDIIKISLNYEKVTEINNYLENEFGITPRSFLVSEAKDLIGRYNGSGELTDYYSKQLLNKLEHTINKIDIDKEEKTLRILAFVQSNKEELFVREVSMIVFGASKIFEEHPFYENICTIIRNATNDPKNEESAIDDILKNYHISNVDQGILLKGNITVSISGYELSIGNLSNGISLTSSDIPLIDYIKINSNNFMTIENKTSFYRFDGKEYSVMYLGGFANRHQIELLKKIISENQNIEYYHFGDIDAGGFFIHQHLCRGTGMVFKLYHMGIDELKNPYYKNCLVKLTENDQERLKSLHECSIYREISQYMLEKNVKLEQEIISLYLHNGRRNIGVKKREGEEN